MARETSRDRRERVAAMQAQAKRAERRRLLIVFGAVVLVLALIGGAVAWAVIGEQRKKDAALEGMLGDVTAAACDPIIDDPATGSADHVGPGTAAADTLRIDYATAPPSSGQHFAQPALSERRVYTVADAPAVEALVHNLEHGYTILWYDPSLQDSQAAQFAALSERINAMPEAQNKFLITPWDSSRGAFPEGKKYALTHWAADVNLQTGEIGEQTGKRQYCGGLNVGVVEDFVTQFPWSSAPEPGAA
ncbi:DUF3105 domain-containing protein [Intrasporangium sp.]|uniref:DUF3105 domain-containing protein n=1 Tax=Intrasporangium sp. TaxID=1925024 RepID=UPI00293A4350|nr:DUF3105 domain-containing protein [Intrasporangium sp.]MDV3222178.1 DUF3105 domain-containing protein [Intrasporangium sp.]